MNVYDFDKTIYPGYCSINFWKYCVKKRPSVLRIIPKSIIAVIKYKLRRCTWREVTETFFGFLKYLSPLEQIVEDFWDSHTDKLYEWYLKKKTNSDVIISAAPYFLVSAVCNRLGVKCIATDLDVETGIIRGKECSGEEKAERYFNEYGDQPIDEFYSDSFTDRPLALLAARAFKVNEGTVCRWETDKPEEEQIERRY